ncbi:MAG: hypothetical protein EHM61_23865 [Acidobacteria bacterium]|nr:MAG: hypothetical protein EHM61_23865 [Acidobacteriota bacterium]
MTHLSEEQLILYYYGELASDELIESHFADCPSCREDYRQLQRTLDSVDYLTVPELPADYEARVWRSVQAGLDKPARRRWLFSWNPPSYVAAGVTMVLLIVAGFLLGRFWPVSAPEVPQLSRNEVRERVLVAAVIDHLDRSQRALLELLNSQANGQTDISSEQAMVRGILEDNRVIRRNAAAGGQAALADVLDDLERSLLDIVHSSSNLSSAELAELRSRLESQSILFKLRVISSQLKRRQDDAARELARRSS